LPDHVLLYHFYHGLNKDAALHLDIASGGSFSHKIVSEGKAILEKILENTPYTGIFYELPEEEVEPSPEQQEETHAAELEIPRKPSNDLVAIEPPTMGTHHTLNTLESDEPHPSIEVDVFENSRNTSNLSFRTRPHKRPPSEYTSNSFKEVLEIVLILMKDIGINSTMACLAMLWKESQAT
jgi:hypothetical protein